MRPSHPFAAQVTKHARIDVEGHKAAARETASDLGQWLVDTFMGDFVYEKDEDELRQERKDNGVTDATNERLKQSIRKKCGLNSGSKFKAVADEINLTHISRPVPQIFDWKEEVKFMCCVDVDEVAALTADDYQRMLDFRTLDIYKDPEREYKKINAPEQMQIRVG